MSDLPMIQINNRSLRDVMTETHVAVRGFITDDNTNLTINNMLVILGQAARWVKIDRHQNVVDVFPPALVVRQIWHHYRTKQPKSR